MDIKPEHVKRFRKIARQMNKLMEEICEYNPEAELYIEGSWNANLMKGSTHDEKGNALQDNVVEREIIYRAGGGGW